MRRAHAEDGIRAQVVVVGFPRASRPGVTMVLVLATAALLGACRASPASVAATDVMTGDTIHGRLVDGRPSQAFTFEGVESCILDFDLVSDDASLAAPQVSLVDPTGADVDLAAHIDTPYGAATTKAREVVLLRTGTYQVVVTPTIPDEPVYYRFSHTLRYVPAEDIRVTLTAGKTYPVYVSAPRGGQVLVKIAPVSSPDLVPQFRGVEDPWGGRGLDPACRPAHAPVPTVSRGHDGTLYLNFTAAIPGRYTVLAAAREGTCGPALISTRVTPVGCPARAVWHPNRPPEDFGLPAAGSASDPLPGP